MSIPLDHLVTCWTPAPVAAWCVDTHVLAGRRVSRTLVYISTPLAVLREQISSLVAVAEEGAHSVDADVRARVVSLHTLVDVQTRGPVVLGQLEARLLAGAGEGAQRVGAGLVTGELLLLQGTLVCVLTAKPVVFQVVAFSTRAAKAAR